MNVNPGVRNVSCVVPAFFCAAFMYAGALNAQPLFTKHKVDSTFTGTHSVQAYDLDGDGDLDLAGAGMTAGRISWWENESGDGAVWNERVVADAFTGARAVGAADLDDDGDLDLFGAAASLDAVTWWENAAGDASLWIEHPVDVEFDFAMFVHSGDVDGDGDLDLLGAALKDDAVTWWENLDGKGLTWSKHTVIDTFDGARQACIIDIDGDGDSDLLGSADIANTVMWWENTVGDASEWTGFVVDSTFLGVNAVVPADIDADGDVDLVGAADIADAIAWWEHKMVDDSLIWTKRTVKADFDGAFSVVTVDMDNDGDLDILGAAAEADQLVWWENVLGSGDEWLEHIVDEGFDYPLTVSAADIDADGDADVISGTFNGEVAWWDNPHNIHLPVELSRFGAIIDQGEVSLKWQTRSETNNAGFEVQHIALLAASTGIDAADWRAVTFVEGAGTTTNPQAYEIAVSDLHAGLHRFRLKQIDFDGGFQLSQTVEIQIHTTGVHDMSDVYPNPFNPQTRFFLSLSSPQKVQIDVYNAIGQRVARLHDGTLPADQAHEFDFEAGDLPGGLYVIHALGESFSTTRTAMLVK